MRFLWSVNDADDVTQEVFLRVVTHLSDYRGEASLTTWAYRIASRHLIDLSRRPAKALTFDEGREHLLLGLAEPAWQGPEEAVLAEEVKIGCTASMLLCLSRPLRLSYVLGSVFDLPGPEAAWILEVDPTVHRKRLQLARKRVRAFMGGICGLYTPANPCRCAAQISYNVSMRRFDPQALQFNEATVRGLERAAVRQLEAVEDDLAIMRSNPETEPGATAREQLRQLVRVKAPPVFG